MGRSKYNNAANYGSITADEWAKRLKERNIKGMIIDRDGKYNQIKQKMLTDANYRISCKIHIEEVKKEIAAKIRPKYIESDEKHIRRLEALLLEAEAEINQKNLFQKIDPKWLNLTRKITDVGTFEFKNKDATVIVSNSDFSNNADLSYIHMALSMLPIFNTGARGQISIGCAPEFKDVILDFVDKYEVPTKNPQIWGEIYKFQKDDLMRAVIGYSFVNKELYKIRVTAVSLPYKEDPLKVIFDYSAIFTENGWKRI